MPYSPPLHYIPSPPQISALLHALLGANIVKSHPFWQKVSKRAGVLSPNTSECQSWSCLFWPEVATKINASVKGTVRPDWI